MNAIYWLAAISCFIQAYYLDKLPSFVLSGQLSLVCFGLFMIIADLEKSARKKKSAREKEAGN